MPNGVATERVGQTVVTPDGSAFSEAILPHAEAWARAVALAPVAMCTRRAAMSSEEPGPVATTDEEQAPSARCPVLSHAHAATGSMANQHWWPDQLNLRPLGKNSP